MILTLSSELSDIANSPFIVPVAACGMVLGIVVSGTVGRLRTRAILSQERLAAIARGLPLPPTQAELNATHGQPASNLQRRYASIRLVGIILVASALGMAAFFAALTVIERERDILAGVACALIPLGIGLGLLYDARLQARELDLQNRVVQEQVATPPSTGLVRTL